MAWDQTVYNFEARVEYVTAKAYLVELTLGGRYWLPKSQLISMEPSDGDELFLFEVKAWWWNKKDPDFDADTPRE